MKPSFLTKIATTAGFVLGAFALSALAGTWTAPTAPAPNGNPDAPINVGNSLQNKLGWLGVKGLVTTDFTLATGTPVAGQVLTAIDSLGNTKWQSLPSTQGGVVSLGPVTEYKDKIIVENPFGGADVTSAQISQSSCPSGSILVGLNLYNMGDNFDKKGSLYCQQLIITANQ